MFEEGLRRGRVTWGPHDGGLPEVTSEVMVDEDVGISETSGVRSLLPSRVEGG